MTNEEILKVKLQLVLANIPLHKWGQGNAKNFHDLIQEISSNETKLYYSNNYDIVIRRTKVIIIDIYYVDSENRRWKLVEEKQAFSNGRVRVRNMGSSVSEKMFQNESVDDAFKRALREELKITGEVCTVFEETYTTRDKSLSYPGLITYSEKHRYSVLLNEEWFNPNGYIEKQRHLTTYFVWKEIKSFPEEYLTFKHRNEQPG